MKMVNRLPEVLGSIAEAHGVDLRRDVHEQQDRASQIANTIYLGEFADPSIEALAFFHELGHILAARERIAVGIARSFCIMSNEGAAWELGLCEAAKNGFTWEYDSYEFNWGRRQYMTYDNPQSSNFGVNSNAPSTLAEKEAIGKRYA